MRLFTMLGMFVVCLSVAAVGQAQVVGGYSTIVSPAPVVISPQQPAPVAPLTAAPSATNQWRSVSRSEPRVAMRPSSEIATVAYQSAPQTIRPIETLQPVPVSLTGGVVPAAYQQPSLIGQTVPVQASAPLTYTQGSQVVGNACCTPCCTPVTQTALMPAPAAIAQLPDGHVFGRGLIGQPVVYVQGQPLRNFFRFVSP